jgi:REP element-mobilizing transposase RayT
MIKITPEKFKGKYRIQSNRLKGYDYSSEGAYFITICAKDRECLFGEIVDEKMVLNDLGKIAFDEWQKTEEIRKNILVDEFVVMPNHLHGILMINETKGRDVLAKRLYGGEHKNMSKISPSKNSISVIIRFFKRQITKYARKNTNIFTVWQSNYYDRIVRNEDELNRIREYILQNPAKWENDRNNAENIFM